ncbi:MAG: ABC transporter ATP-binding protein [Clostridia bacterium]|nr:ABC transporter ATP-binding protein [Clostridia bacterium]
MKGSATMKNGKLWLKKEMRPYRGAILLLTLFLSLSTVFSLAFAYLVKYVINSATDGKANTLWVFSAVLLSLILLKILFKTLDGFYTEKLRSKIVTNLRVKIFNKILRSDYATITRYHSGELLNRLTSDVQEIAAYTVGLLPVLTSMLIQCIGAIVLLLTINPLFTAVYVVCGGAFGVLAALFRRQIKKRQKAFLAADDIHRAFMQEGISASMTVKAYGAEKQSTEKSAELAKEYYKARMDRNFLRSGINAVFALLSNSGLILAVVWCAVSILNNPVAADYGAMLSVILLLMQFQQPLSGFSAVIPAYYARIASGERLAEIEDIPTENLTDTPKPLDFERIFLKNLSFAYDKEEVLSKTTLTINKGEILSLTGASGTGKSTLFKLLLGLYTPTDGEILLENEKESVALQAKHRNLFAYVPQGNFLFLGTIYENLTFFAENGETIDDEKIKSALQIACADFVFDLPNGLNTRLTERGGGLSEGQLQRLAVARAILSNRPILLLDEATSALDSETETRLLENIKKLQDKTCLIVTHRPAALAISNRVLTINQNTISE